MQQLKIATWNVNSLRVRLPHLYDWISNENPDVIALQETKVDDASFPLNCIEEVGYKVVFTGQKSYNGVAILSKTELTDVEIGMSAFDDPQRRVLAATTSGVRIINLYVPNGESVGSEKYQYKLEWLKTLNIYLKQALIQYPHLVVLGDFNIAPEDIDVHDPIAWQGSVLVSEAERKAFQAILKNGFEDTFRLLNPTSQTYSWWDYRAAAFKRNRGLRIDHVLINKGLAEHCKGCHIDKAPRGLERPSDHTPVVALFEIP